MSVLGDLPEGVTSAMFLRDGWPDAVVCKVVMKSGCVGIGIVRSHGKITPAQADDAAMINAITHVAAEPPDYTELRDYLEANRIAAELAAAAREAQEEPDNDLQASLGQKAHE